MAPLLAQDFRISAGFAIAKHPSKHPADDSIHVMQLPESYGREKLVFIKLNKFPPRKERERERYSCVPVNRSYMWQLQTLATFLIK